MRIMAEEVKCMHIWEIVQRFQSRKEKWAETLWVNPSCSPKTHSLCLQVLALISFLTLNNFSKQYSRIILNSVFSLFWIIRYEVHEIAGHIICAASAVNICNSHTVRVFFIMSLPLSVTDLLTKFNFSIQCKVRFILWIMQITLIGGVSLDYYFTLRQY